MKRSVGYGNMAKSNAQHLAWSLLPVLAVLGSVSCGRSDLLSTEMNADARSHRSSGVDMQTDNQDDGSCESVCSAVAPSTATCVLGRCLATLAVSPRFVKDFAVDATHVYWISVWGSNSQIMKTPISGGNSTALAAVSPALMYIAVDAQNVYGVSSGGKVTKVALGGGNPTVLSSEPEGVKGGIAVDATNVYWPIWATASDFVPVEGHGAVLTTPISGGGTPTALISGLTRPEGLTADSKNLYWTAVDMVKNETVLMAAPKGNGAPTILAPGPFAQGIIATDTSNIYACSNDDIVQIPMAGGAPTVLVAQAGCGPMAVDANSLYWAKLESDYPSAPFVHRTSIMRVPLAGGPAAVLAAADTTIIMKIVVDGTSIYWPESMRTGQFALMRLTPK